MHWLKKNKKIKALDFPPLGMCVGVTRVVEVADLSTCVHTALGMEFSEKMRIINYPLPSFALFP